MPEVSELCKVGEACLKGAEAFYPGGTFFIDPDGMTSLQLVFMFVVYGYVLFISADMIGDGAELLLLVPGYADMVGSIVLPILGAIPDGMMVLFSGIGPLAVAQENVAVGVGALAGSTIMLLTLPWILSVYAAQVDCDADGKCIGYKQPAGKRNQTEQTACCFNDGVTKNAWLMFITSLSYFVIQIPAYKVDDQKTRSEYASAEEYLKEVVLESKTENYWALIGVFTTLFFFFFYLYLQYLAALKKEPPISCLKAFLPPPPAPVSLEKVKKHGVLPLIDNYRQNFKTTGRMRVSAQEVAIPYADEPLSKAAQLPQDLTVSLKLLFNEYAAKTADAGLHGDDMRQLLHVIGLRYTPDAFNKKFAAADADKGGFLDQLEFLNFFYEMLTGADPLPYEEKNPAPAAPADSSGGDDEDEEDEMPDEFKDLSPDEQRKQIIQSSLKQMCIGTFLVLIFSDPMVDVLAQIGKMTGVPAFYVSFLLAPLASNASELVSSMKLASRKTSGSITQSLQTLEGAACMNNTFCLGIFFYLIYAQGLAWKFTAETLCIFLIQFLVFLIVIKSNTQTMKMGVIIFLCYPVSLVFVAGLEAMGFD
jgi:Ca2+/Na+ antiporter